MPDPRDQVEIGTPDASAGHPRPDTGPGGRPSLSVYFRCARQYLRVYRNPEGTAYHARCPACAKAVRFQVGQGGTDRRFFEVSC